MAWNGEGWVSLDLPQVAPVTYNGRQVGWATIYPDGHADFQFDNDELFRDKDEQMHLSLAETSYEEFKDEGIY